MPRQHPEDHFGRGPRRDLVDQCSAYACPMRAHAKLTRRTKSTCRSPRNRNSPGRSRRAHPACACVRRVRRIDKAPRKSPRNSDLRREPQREPAGHSIVNTQKRAKNQTNYWRGFCQFAIGSRVKLCESAGHHGRAYAPPWRPPAQCRARPVGLPEKRAVPPEKLRIALTFE